MSLQQAVHGEVVGRPECLQLVLQPGLLVSPQTLPVIALGLRVLPTRLQHQRQVPDLVNSIRVIWPEDSLADLEPFARQPLRLLKLALKNQGPLVELHRAEREAVLRRE